MNDTELHSHISNGVYGFAGEKKKKKGKRYSPVLLIRKTPRSYRYGTPGCVDKYYLRSEFITKQNPLC